MSKFVKFLFVAALLVICVPAFAATYYVSSTYGNDANTGQADASGFAWASITGHAGVTAGDVINIDAGAYSGSYLGLTPGATYNAEGNVTYSSSNSNYGVILYGNTVVNGINLISNNLSGFYVEYSGNTIENCSTNGATYAVNVATTGNVNTYTNNVFENASYGVYTIAGSNSMISKNLIEGCSQFGILNYGTASIVHNTIVGCYYGAYTTGTFNDNIAASDTGYGLNGSTTHNNNDFFNASVIGGIHAGDILTDPLFNNAAGGDFSLKAGSPCIGTADDGLNMGAFGVASVPEPGTLSVLAMGMFGLFGLRLRRK